MDIGKVKRTYNVDKKVEKQINYLAEIWTDGNKTQILNEVLKFGVSCLFLMMKYGVEKNIEDMDKIYEEGLDVYIKNKRSNS